MSYSSRVEEVCRVYGVLVTEHLIARVMSKRVLGETTSRPRVIPKSCRPRPVSLAFTIHPDPPYWRPTFFAPLFFFFFSFYFNLFQIPDA